jgi:hypothetical protein
MKTIIQIVHVSVLAVLGASCAAGQQAAAPAVSGPTLEVTLNFIAAKINETGVIHIHEHMGYLQAQYNYDHDWGTTNATVNIPQCSVFYYSFTKPGSVTVMTALQARNEDDDPGNFSRTMSPVAYVVRMRQNPTSDIYFRDQDTASRVAKAVQHAMEICGGASKDPF